MHSANICDIAIIGGGFSGAMTAVNLIRAGLSPLKKITLVDPSAAPGRGLAYGTWDDNFLLNVPAGNMSALDGVPQHFVDYCRTIDPALNDGSFVSRRIYGDYLQHTLRAAQQNWGGVLEGVSAQVVAVRRQIGDAGFAITLANGGLLHAARVVLALGHFAPKAPAATLHLPGVSARYVDNPWDVTVLNQLPSDLPILLVGTGLTAIDTLFRVNSDGKRSVILLSRKGLLPHGHRTTPRQPAAVGFPADLDKPSLSVRDCLQYLRHRAKQHVNDGGDWRDAVNELRAHTPEIWHRWSTRERRRFLRHAVGYWDIHRHRLAPVADFRLREILASGSVDKVAGRLEECWETRDGFDIRVRLRGTGECRELKVGAIVNCTGPNSDVLTVRDRLTSQLLAEGLVSPDEVRIGLRVSEKYEVIDRHGTPIQHCYYVGPLLKAMFWEAIAVPELRVHARRLADQLIRSYATD